MNTSLTFGSMRRIAPPSPCHPPPPRPLPLWVPKIRFQQVAGTSQLPLLQTITVNIKGKIILKFLTLSMLLSHIPATHHHFFQTAALQTALKLLTPVIIHLHPPPPASARLHPIKRHKDGGAFKDRKRYTTLEVAWTVANTMLHVRFMA